MKSKKSLYILLAAVVIIWGLIIYRIITNVSFSAKQPQIYSNTHQVETKQLVLDSFSIVANYRDPFLDKRRKLKTTKPVVKKTAIKKKIVEKPVKNIIKPNYNIRYKGLIAKQSNNKSLAILSINGKEVLLRYKENYKDLTLLKILKDSVLIGSPNGNFYIKRK
jgi:type II secretory pathway component PulC